MILGEKFQLGIRLPAGRALHCDNRPPVAGGSECQYLIGAVTLVTVFPYKQRCLITL